MKHEAVDETKISGPLASRSCRCCRFRGIKRRPIEPLSAGETVEDKAGMRQGDKPKATAAKRGNKKKTDKDGGRFAMSNQPDNVTVENGRKNCTVVGAVNGGYIAKVLADRAEPQNDGDCEDLGCRLMWLLGLECLTCSTKTALQGGGFFFFFFSC